MKKYFIISCVNTASQGYENTLPDNFEEVGLIIDEYKKLKVNPDLDSLKINKKNKPILVKGENFEKQFESITDTIKYFDSLNIKLDRKSLNLGDFFYKKKYKRWWISLRDSAS
nr:hypothetical protein [Ophiocordyceps lanpingensis]